MTTDLFPIEPFFADPQPRALSLSITVTPIYRSGNGPRRRQSLSKRMRKCKLCLKAPRGICGRHSLESRRGA